MFPTLSRSFFLAIKKSISSLIADVSWGKGVLTNYTNGFLTLLLRGYIWMFGRKASVLIALNLFYRCIAPGYVKSFIFRDFLRFVQAQTTARNFNCSMYELWTTQLPHTVLSGKNKSKTIRVLSWRGQSRGILLGLPISLWLEHPLCKAPTTVSTD